MMANESLSYDVGESMNELPRTNGPIQIMDKIATRNASANANANDSRNGKRIVYEAGAVIAATALICIQSIVLQLATMTFEPGAEMIGLLKYSSITIGGGVEIEAEAEVEAGIEQNKTSLIRIRSPFLGQTWPLILRWRLAPSTGWSSSILIKRFCCRCENFVMQTLSP
jgi:hypothetical protein